MTIATNVLSQIVNLPLREQGAIIQEAVRNNRHWRNLQYPITRKNYFSDGSGIEFHSTEWPHGYWQECENIAPHRNQDDPFYPSAYDDDGKFSDKKFGDVVRQQDDARYVPGRIL